MDKECDLMHYELKNMNCIKCFGQDFSCGIFATRPIKVVLPQIVSVAFGEMYLIKGLELKVGDFLCPKCLDNILNNSESTIQIEKYCDVKCNVCMNQYSRVNIRSWKAWGCATNFLPTKQQFSAGFGSCYDDDHFSIISKDELCNHWKNINLSELFIICDNCLKYGVSKLFLRNTG